MSQISSIIDFTDNINAGTFGVAMLTLTTPKMRKTNNPYFGRVQKCTLTTNVALGYDYANNVNLRLERKGVEGEKFVAEKPNGKTWVKPKYILCADKDAKKMYLRCTMRPTTKAVVRYLIDKRFATDKEIAEIKGFMPAPSTSKKQESAGLTEEEQVIVRDYGFDGIIYLAQGNKIYSHSVEAEVLYNAMRVLK